MRGIPSIFLGRELPPQGISTVLVVCSADKARCPQILPMIQRRFPKAQLTYVVPEEYLGFLPQNATRYLISELKTSALQVSWEVRSRKYDVTALMLTGQPIFRKAKLWALFTNYRMLAIYNENLDSFTCAGQNRMALIRHVRWRFREKGSPSLSSGLLATVLSPLGFLYLLCFTGAVLVRSRLRLWASGSNESSN